MVLLIIKVLSLFITGIILIAAVIIGIEVYHLNKFMIEEFLGSSKPKGTEKRTEATSLQAPAQKKAAQAMDATTIESEALGHWQRMRQSLDSGLRHELGLTILSVDSFLASLLKQRGYTGETMGDRLKEAALDNIPSIERLWKAHKVRNRVAHEHGTVTDAELREAVELYELVFRDWGLI